MVINTMIVTLKNLVTLWKINTMNTKKPKKEKVKFDEFDKFKIKTFKVKVKLGE